MQKVIHIVRQTLNDLHLAIDGTIIMNESLRDALDCMYDARIPKLWLKVFTYFLRIKEISLIEIWLYTRISIKYIWQLKLS